MRYTVAGKGGASRMDTETGCRGAMSLNCPKCGIGLLDPDNHENVVWACQSTPHSQSSECRISVLIKIRGELVEALEEMIRAETPTHRYAAIEEAVDAMERAERS